VIEAGASTIAAAATSPARDDGSFGAFFAAHYHPALRLAALLSGDQSRAEDAVCDAFAKVYARWRRGGIDNVDAYLRQAVVNTLRSGWRRRAVEQRTDAGVRQLVRSAHAAAAGFEQRVVERDAIWAALAELSDGQRRVLVLRYYEDLSEIEIARLLGIAVGTVKSQAARGLARLQRLLDAYRAEGA
jgi:RNA polymerase sigma-70 factor (sigma-E family)